MDKLSKADQDLIKKAAWDSMDYQREQWAGYVKVSEEKIRAAGNTITPIPDNSAWQAAMKPLYDKLSANLKEVVRRVQEVQ
jgi:TRAP-type C4-dicarboxylate transport system substrate-binding protein